MSLETMRAFISDKFNTEFSAAQPTISIVFENQKFVQDQNVSWVHFIDVPGLLQRSNVGDNNRLRQHGIFNIACMVPENTGSRNMNLIVDSVNAIMMDKKWAVGDGQLVTHKTEIRKRGIISGWSTVNIMPEFRYDYTGA